ncbi:MAG TPA: type 3 dihydrofolate reductase [Chitinophagaceae bacterium]|jgi:dihydrofolate reductase|nr:type 3 dihydrofolate reductase [Chitinophagaceae bacterium]
MTISFVVAAATNNAIGKDGVMPWHLPNDMRHFKNVTWGMPVVMGRKTFESLGKVLPGRKNIVITRQPGWEVAGTIAVQKIEDALFVAKQTDANEVMVIGGGEIYKTLFDKASRIYLTRVEAEPEADTFFPALDPKEWHLMSQKDHEADEKNAFNYSFQIWERLK